MKPGVAIIGSTEASASGDLLCDALRAKGIRCDLCGATEPRDILRWAMELSPDEHAVCIFADPDGRLTASITTALDPAIAAVVWSPPPSDPTKLATILSETPALVCFGKDPKTPVQVVGSLLSAATAQEGGTREAARPRSANIENVPTKPAPPRKPDHDEGDIAAYRQLEAMMSAPVKEVVQRQEPVEIQKAGLDFSLPLRRLMTHGNALAHKNAHSEVLGAHYLGALDEPYLSAFTAAGLDHGTVKNYLSGFDGGENNATDPVISDEVFDAVSLAKKRARDNVASCVRVADFLYGLLQVENSSVNDILGETGMSVEVLQEALDAVDSPNEVCGGSFFNPSSLDQESFYQFDPSQVRSVEQRLKNLPGFQKAAERVAEVRSKKTAAGPNMNAPAQTVPVTMPLAPPPDKPEILKVAGEFPSVDVIEQVADRLLEGQIVAFPSDIMMAVAVDAANPGAVERLREAAGVADSKPLSILINSTSQLKHLVKADLDQLEPLLDELWPGPLTLVFQSAGATGPHIASAGTIAVRQPADNISLAILSMLGRPLAVTSWDKKTDDLTGRAAIILTAADTPLPARTTVVDVTQRPWQVLREGAVPGASVLGFEPEH